MIAPFILDFYCVELKLAIEVDGDGHEYRRDYDRARDLTLAGQGITVLRVGNYEARLDPGSVVDLIKQHISERASLLRGAVERSETEG